MAVAQQTFEQLKTAGLAEIDPERLAHIVVENTDPAHPRLLLDSNP